MTFQVSLRSYHHDAANAAATLWNSCLAPLAWQHASQPVAVHGADSTFQASVWPSLASDTRRRLTGCIEDTTLDRVKADVTATADGP